MSDRQSSPPTDTTTPTDQNLVYGLRSAANPQAYLRMDGQGVTKPEPEGAGTVNGQTTMGPWEQFTLVPQDDGTVALRSVFWAPCAVRCATILPGEEKNIDCQYGVRGPLEKWKMTVSGDNLFSFESIDLPGYFLALDVPKGTEWNGDGVGRAYATQSQSDLTQFELISHQPDSSSGS